MLKNAHQRFTLLSNGLMTIFLPCFCFTIRVTCNTVLYGLLLMRALYPLWV